MLVGQGARGAASEVSRVAERARRRESRKALLGKDVLSDELPWVTGAIGLLGTRPSYELMTDCEHAAGRRLQLPLQPVPAAVQRTGRRACEAVQIDVDPTMVGLRYPFRRS